MPSPRVTTDDAAATAAPTLSAAALGGQRGERPLFRGLDLELQPGMLVWLRGRNGRGKTSLLRILAGLARPARGQALLDGHDVHRLPAEQRQRLLYIAHANALKDDLSVAEALLFLARLQGRSPAAAELAAALAQIGLTNQRDQPVRTLSQGQRRRAALARLALPQPPSVWLLDEPYDALDDEGVRVLNRLLAGHARAGGSALLTSHQALSLDDAAVQTLDLDRYAVEPLRAPVGALAPA
jgi:heme exporter protein A